MRAKFLWFAKLVVIKMRRDDSAKKLNFVLLYRPLDKFWTDFEKKKIISVRHTPKTKMATKRIIDFYYYLFFQWGLNVWRLDHIFAQNCRRPFSLTIYFFNEAHRCYLGGSMFFADLQPRIYGFVKRESEFWLWLPTLKKKKNCQYSIFKISLKIRTNRILNWFSNFFMWNSFTVSTWWRMSVRNCI